MNIKITVLMSCFNSEAWLSSAIDSVISQSYENFEFLIINDGSTDGTLNIINDYKKLDSRIKLVSKNNTGLADSLNVGILMAEGDWIARLDSDDVCYKDRLQEQLRCVGNDGGVVLVGSSYDEIDEYGNVVRFHKFPEKSIDIKNRLMSDMTFFPHSSAFYNKKVVIDNGMYRGKIKRAEDLDLWLRLSRVGKIKSLPLNLVGIRKHENQISHDEGGRRQVLDAIAAKVSHKIHLAYGEKYEPINKIGGEFENYMKWLELNMNELGVFQENSNWRVAADKYKSNNSKIERVLALIHDIIYNKYVRSKVFKKVLNKSTSDVLFKRWVRFNNML